MAVHHALLVVLRDAVSRAERDADRVVGSRQIDVGDTGAGVGRVDDGLAVGTVVNVDTGFDGALVGGIECQRHVVEVLLKQLDRPGHQLGAVGLGRADVDVKIRCAGLDLLCGTLEDGIGVERCHCLADDRGDAVDALADGDELGRFGISLLVVRVQIVADLDGGDGSSDLLEVQRRVGVDGFLLLLGRLLGRGNRLGSLDVLAVLEVLDQLDSLAGADDDVPIRQLVLDLALHDSDLARDDEGAVVDLGGDFILVKELLDGAGGELAGGPCRQDGHAGSIGDEQVDRNLGALEFAGDQEVGQREVDRQGAGIVGAGAVDRVEARSDLHGLLRVGVDVLTQAVQRQSLCIGHSRHDDDRAVLQREHGSQRGSQMILGAAELAEINDRRIAEGAVVVLKGSAADLNGVAEGLLDGGAGDVEQEVLVAGLLECLDGVVQFVEVRSLNAENDAVSLGKLVHGLEVVLVDAVDNGLCVLDGLDGSLGGLNVGGLEDHAALQRCGLLGKLDKAGVVAAVADGDEFHVLALADTLVIDALELRDLCLDRSVVHLGVDGDCEQVAGDEGLLMTEQNRLAAELVRADRDGLHGRRGGLGQKGDRLFGHIRALGDGNSALCDLHAECHAGGAAAFLTILLGR